VSDLRVGQRARRTRRLRTTITNQDGTIVLDGEALVWIEPM